MHRRASGMTRVVAGMKRIPLESPSVSRFHVRSAMTEVAAATAFIAHWVASEASQPSWAFRDSLLLGSVNDDDNKRVTCISVELFLILAS